MTKFIVNHKDANKLNNNFTNLEWVSQKENMATRSKETKPRDVGYKETELLNASNIVWRDYTCKNGKEVLVSNTGLVKIKDFITNGTLSSDYRFYAGQGIHRIVAEIFIGLPENHAHLIVNHIDGNKENNRVENLEWITPSQNSLHASDNGLMDKHKRKIRQYNLGGSFIKDYGSQADASRELGISEDSMNLCLRGLGLSAGGFIWRYIEDDTPMSVEPVLKGTREIVKCRIETDEVLETFVSITDASRKLSISFTQIKRMCENKILHSDWYLKFLNSEDEQKYKEKAKAREVERVGYKTFPSVKKAAKELHYGESTMCETNGKDKEGFEWRFKN